MGPKTRPGEQSRQELLKGPEFFEGARLLAAARAIPAAHHALVKFLFGANDPVTASMDTAALDTDRGGVWGAGSPICHPGLQYVVVAQCPGLASEFALVSRGHTCVARNPVHGPWKALEEVGSVVVGSTLLFTEGQC